MSGGYDAGYLSCPCFWGESPGSLIKLLDKSLNYSQPLNVLDLGCGEGKNSIFFADKGAKVTAIDLSEAGLANAKKFWPKSSNVEWFCIDVRTIKLDIQSYDLVIAYGLFHCFECFDEINNGVSKMQSATKLGGYNILCAFNDRYQDLSAHPGFNPTLLPHDYYINAYSGWEILFASDEDLHETHPHNNIPHTHSLTRLIARKVS